MRTNVDRLGNASPLGPPNAVHAHRALARVTSRISFIDAVHPRTPTRNAQPNPAGVDLQRDPDVDDRRPVHRLEEARAIEHARARSARTGSSLSRG
jgi:hypothetical protein